MSRDEHKYPYKKVESFWTYLYKVKHCYMSFLSRFTLEYHVIARNRINSPNENIKEIIM